MTIFRAEYGDGTSITAGSSSDVITKKADSDQCFEIIGIGIEPDSPTPTTSYMDKCEVWVDKYLMGTFKTNHLGKNQLPYPHSGNKRYPPFLFQRLKKAFGNTYIPNIKVGADQTLKVRLFAGSSDVTSKFYATVHYLEHYDGDVDTEGHRVSVETYASLRGGTFGKEKIVNLMGTNSMQVPAGGEGQINKSLTVVKFPFEAATPSGMEYDLLAIWTAPHDNQIGTRLFRQRGETEWIDYLITSPSINELPVGDDGEEGDINFMPYVETYEANEYPSIKVVAGSGGAIPASGSLYGMIFLERRLR